MHAVRFVLLYIMLSIFGLLVCLFFAQNFRTEHLTYFGVVFSLNFVWILLGAATSGFLLTVILLLPGHIAMAFHGRRLEQEIQQLEEQVNFLQEQRERMIDQHEDILAGHERILLRHQRLLSDYTQVVAKLDQAQKRLAEHDQLQKALAEQAQVQKQLAEQKRLAEEAQRKLAEQEQKRLTEREEAQRKLAERERVQQEQVVAAAPRVVSVLTLPKNQRPATDLPANVAAVSASASARPQQNDSVLQQHDSAPATSSQPRLMLETLGMLYKTKITRPVIAATRPVMEALALRPWLISIKGAKQDETASSNLKAEAEVSASENYDN